MWVRSLAQGWSQGGCCSVFLPGGSSREGPTSQLPQVVDRIHFLVAVEFIAICFFKARNKRVSAVWSLLLQRMPRPSWRAHLIRSGPCSLSSFDSVSQLITSVKFFHFCHILLEASHRPCPHSRGGSYTKAQIQETKYRATLGCVCHIYVIGLTPSHYHSPQSSPISVPWINLNRTTHFYRSAI